MTWGCFSPLLFAKLMPCFILAKKVFSGQQEHQVGVHWSLGADGRLVTGSEKTLSPFEGVFCMDSPGRILLQRTERQSAGH